MKSLIIDRILLVSVACAAFFMLRCADLSGGGSEAGNARINGRVMDTLGYPVRNAMVTVLPFDFDPVKSISPSGFNTDTTGTDGTFGITIQKGRTYTIQAVHSTLRTRALLAGVTVGDSDITTPQCTLNTPGAVKVRIPDGTDKAPGYVYIPGTTVLSTFDAADSFTVLDSVPAGIVPAVSYSSGIISVSTVIRYHVPVIPGDTTTVHNPLWKYSRRLFLNTTAGGADVSGDVHDFPVLVRLSAKNFTFAQAKADGTDIRFTKQDNTYLPHEIERWDPVAGLAEVWVKVDTIFGNDSSQSITMYWGNPDVFDSSNGAAVFDTAAGFQGTWHLGETDSLAPDATVNRYNGTGYFTAPVAGMIGNAQRFNGASSFLQMKGTAQSRLSFPMNGRYTVSAWVYHDTLADSVTYLVAGKGELQYFMKTFGLAQSTTQHAHHWEFTEYHGNDIWQAVTLTPAVAKTWTYIVGIRDGSNQYLYVNGALAMEGYRTFGTGQTAIPRDTSDDFTIGAFLHPVTVWDQGYAFFSGAIDEVGVSSLPRSADWIKLSYMNQKEQDALVKW
jgi:hypothetical protein